ncbi:hypothetical protein [Streptomyces sp. NPDC059786]|uniref:hypothetical protein n=1 Tax=Streptomyces sp. NPDC059786 TaxID=3346946 RepID=UPI003666EC01
MTAAVDLDIYSMRRLAHAPRHFTRANEAYGHGRRLLECLEVLVRRAEELAPGIAQRTGDRDEVDRITGMSRDVMDEWPAAGYWGAPAPLVRRVEDLALCCRLLVGVVGSEGGRRPWCVLCERFREDSRFLPLADAGSGAAATARMCAECRGTEHGPRRAPLGEVAACSA